jgi:hypothetical protein
VTYQDDVTPQPITPARMRVDDPRWGPAALQLEVGPYDELTDWLFSHRDQGQPVAVVTITYRARFRQRLLTLRTSRPGEALQRLDRIRATGRDVSVETDAGAVQIASPQITHAAITY